MNEGLAEIPEEGDGEDEDQDGEDVDDDAELLPHDDGQDDEANAVLEAAGVLTVTARRLQGVKLGRKFNGPKTSIYPLQDSWRNLKHFKSTSQLARRHFSGIGGAGTLGAKPGEPRLISQFPKSGLILARLRRKPSLLAQAPPCSVCWRTICSRSARGKASFFYVRLQTSRYI